MTIMQFNVIKISGYAQKIKNLTVTVTGVLIAALSDWNNGLCFRNQVDLY